MTLSLTDYVICSAIFQQFKVCGVLKIKFVHYRGNVQTEDFVCISVCILTGYICV